MTFNLYSKSVLSSDGGISENIDPIWLSLWWQIGPSRYNINRDECRIVWKWNCIYPGNSIDEIQSLRGNRTDGILSLEGEPPSRNILRAEIQGCKKWSLIPSVQIYKVFSLRLFIAWFHKDYSSLNIHETSLGTPSIRWFWNIFEP